MQGIVFTGNRRVELMEFPDPEPRPGEVVVQIRASGMCGSDLHFRRMEQPMEDPMVPIIQGHEPCGVIHSVGDGVSPQVATVGKRVMIHHYWGCGVCEECRSGWPQMCTGMIGRVPTRNEHGGHAQYMRLPALQTMPLPDELSFRAGAAIGCGTGTAWGGILRAGPIQGKTVAILGQGPVGLSATMFASALGARTIAVDLAEERLNKAKTFGADAVINAKDTDVLGAMLDLTRGRGPDVVLETTGASRAATQAIDMVGTWGTVCFIGLGADVTFNTTATYKKQISLKTSWTLSTVELIRCANFVVEHDLRVDDLFSHSWKLDQAVEAYEWFEKQSDGKGVFEF